MLKWVFNTPHRLLTAAEKQRIAEGMAAIYTSAGLPAFYCHAHFVEFAADSVYTAGAPSTDVATVAIYHIAGVFDKPEMEQAFLAAFDDVVRPVFKAKASPGSRASTSRGGSCGGSMAWRRRPG